MRQIKIFRDIVGESEVDKEKSINDFLKEINEDMDKIENFITPDGEVVVIITYYILSKITGYQP